MLDLHAELRSPATVGDRADARCCPSAEHSRRRHADDVRHKYRIDAESHAGCEGEAGNAGECADGQAGEHRVISPKPKTPIPVAAKANPESESESELPAPPVRRTKSSPMAGKIALLAAALGLAFLFAGGIVFAIVKIASPRVQLAANGQKSGPDDPDNKSNGSLSPDGKGSTNAVLTAEENEQLRIKLREETKQVLKRKIKVGDDDPDWQPDLDHQQQGRGQHEPDSEANQLEAIDKGIVFLKASQLPTGTWNASYGVGHAAIGGLTLLECKVPADDPAVQRAAFFVRANVGNLGGTYELSLATLFLDRLGDPRDRTVIQALALRLLAGQNECGGWTYNCPILTPVEMLQLFNFLQSNRKPSLLDPLQGNAPGGGHVAPQADPLQVENPFQHFNVVAQNPAPNPKKPVRNQPKMAPIRPDMLQGNLQNLPVVRNQAALKGKMILRHGAGDNSNTQFALLALWTARRHGVPTDPAAPRRLPSGSPPHQERRQRLGLRANQAQLRATP